MTYGLASGLHYSNRTGSKDDRVLSRRLVFMQVVKLAILGVLAFVVIRFAPVWYRASEFNSYVQQQTSGIHSKGVLTKVILQKAEKSNLPVKARDINFTTNDSVMQVNIEYQVPLDLYFYQKDLSFHASGTGLFPEN
jgi:hypothetical protein